jgi:hypothetical protein
MRTVLVKNVVSQKHYWGMPLFTRSTELDKAWLNVAAASTRSFEKIYHNLGIQLSYFSSHTNDSTSHTCMLSGISQRHHQGKGPTRVSLLQEFLLQRPPMLCQDPPLQKVIRYVTINICDMSHDQWKKERFMHMFSDSPCRAPGSAPE